MTPPDIDNCTDRSPLTGHISFQKTKANVKIAGLLALTLTLSTLALYTLLSPAAPTNPLSPIKHVVIFMQENRAYDHYFGTLSGLRGYNDRATTPVFGLDAFHQPTSNVTDEYMLPFLAEKDKTNAMCMPAPEMYYPTDIRMWNKGRQDRWNTERDPGLGMSYFDRQGLPFYYTLFDNFVAGDQYFQSTFTSTTPNRMMLFSGSNGLSVGEFATEDNTEPVPGFDWPTIGELLEEKGVSWKVYQEADNFDDNGFAWHANFQKSVAGDILFDKGMHRYSSAITEFANDVESATLPSVSWIIAPRPFSEHATAHPAAGEDFTSRLLTALQGNPDVYKETAFILNYDEGGQFYDHARAPTPPLDASQGVSTVDVEGEVNRDALIEEAGNVPAPNGLGFRVPLLLISPWTRGNIAYSELTDHTSVIQFLEKRFGIHCSNISPWRRAMTGDLTAAFDFDAPDYTWPDLPDTSEYVDESQVECDTLPDIMVPAEQIMPVQEEGVRVSRALDYRFVVSGGVGDGKLGFRIENVGKWGAPFALFDVTNNEVVDPKQYAVEGGKFVEHEIELVGADYSYFLFGPNGFVRSWSGSGVTTGGTVSLEYDEEGDCVVFVASEGAGAVAVVDNAYGREEVELKGGETVRVNVAGSSNWYDYSVGGQRFMGRMENGRDGTSDPAMAEGKPGLWQETAVGGGRVLGEHPLVEERLRTLKRTDKPSSGGGHKDEAFVWDGGGRESEL